MQDFVIAKMSAMQQTLQIHTFAPSSRANMHTVHIESIALCFATFLAQCKSQSEARQGDILLEDTACFVPPWSSWDSSTSISIPVLPLIPG